MKFFLIFLIFINTSIFSSNIIPIPKSIDYNLNKALLGKKLFNDKRLSSNNTISCASCHNLDEGGDDNLVYSIGVDGTLGNINAPTVLNAVFNFRQFWDGRAKNLEEQALGPIENPIEMAHDFSLLLPQLNNSEYKDEFLKIYDNGITKKNLANAIAEFEKTLITPNSKFDKYLNGDETVLSEYEKEGFEIFKNKGCISCHHGINIGGNHYNKFGAIIDIDSNNLGLFNITKNKNDKYYFKVPSLRNIELTAPYFHDGRYLDLEETVKTMALVQLGRPISDDEISKIIAFLKTLTGKLEIIK
ncbi:MAG: cytochrome B6 [Arcobacter sp.]|nr:MAG: cytochrome B6 [Arcobacter sp.]